MADFAACKKNPFTQEVSRPIVTSLQYLSEIGKILCPYRFCPIRHVLLNDLNLCHKIFKNN